MNDETVAIWYVNDRLEDIAKYRGRPDAMYRKILQFQLELVKIVESNTYEDDDRPDEWPDINAIEAEAEQEALKQLEELLTNEKESKD